MSITLLPSSWLTGKELTVIVAAYLLGCFTAGYYWVRWRSGLDIRHEGSGTVGARNVGRLLGASGFIVTLLLDVAKGALAVTMGAYFGLRPEAMVACMVAVVVGHSWPCQLRFHGGKGVATCLGAIFTYDPFIALVLVALFLPLFALVRSFTLAGLLAFTLSPLVLFFRGEANVDVAAASFLAILLLVTHRRNIREEFARYFPDRPVKDATMHRHKSD